MTAVSEAPIGGEPSTCHSVCMSSHGLDLSKQRCSVSGKHTVLVIHSPQTFWPGSFEIPHRQYSQCCQSGYDSQASEDMGHSIGERFGISTCSSSCMTWTRAEKMQDQLTIDESTGLQDRLRKSVHWGAVGEPMTLRSQNPHVKMLSS